MSKQTIGRYKLWVRWAVQNADDAQHTDDWSLVFSTDDDLDELFLCKVKHTQDGNSVLLTQDVKLEVDLA